ncbi:hypothetical protein [Burkholderia glumae]|uniref:hypothetical protein n=1 Tax=Burkholderia glumae TaxID=337 RepID=UPI001594D787|nr:hypothetical protein [Burkholderia glumae]NVE26336.1 hypothetical protein [Burkholderia glumae]
MTTLSPNLPPTVPSTLHAALKDAVVAAAEAWHHAHKRLEQHEYAALGDSVWVRVLRLMRWDRSHVHALAKARDEKVRCEDDLALAVGCLNLRIARNCGISADGNISGWPWNGPEGRLPCLISPDGSTPCER